MWNYNCSSTQGWKHRQSQVTQSRVGCVKILNIVLKLMRGHLQFLRKGSTPPDLHFINLLGLHEGHRENSKKGHLGSNYGSAGEKWWGPEPGDCGENKVKRTDLTYLEGRMDINWLSDLKEERSKTMTPRLLGWTTRCLNPFQNRLLGLIGGGHDQQQRADKGQGCCQCCPGLLVGKSLAMPAGWLWQIPYLSLWTSCLLCTILPPVGVGPMECKQPLIIGIDEIEIAR